MGRTLLSTREIGSVQRNDIDITTTGQALVTKLVAGTNISFSSTGVDAGTGDVTINASGGSSSLTSTYIGYGDGSNVLTGSSKLTWNNSSNTMNLNYIASTPLPSSVELARMNFGFNGSITMSSISTTDARMDFTGGSGNSTGGAGLHFNTVYSGGIFFNIGGAGDVFYIDGTNDMTYIAYRMQLPARTSDNLYSLSAGQLIFRTDINGGTMRTYDGSNWRSVLTLNANDEALINTTDQGNYKLQVGGDIWSSATNVLFTGLASGSTTPTPTGTEHIVTIDANGLLGHRVIPGIGSSIVRSITSVTGTTSAGSTAGTDFVYLASGTFTITLPTAVGNTNRYTIKNTGSGTISIGTTSSQTIDGGAAPISISAGNSLDLISDNANWFII